MVPIINHWFVTDRSLIKGHVRTGDRRLSTFLESQKKQLLTIEDITLVDLETRQRVVALRGYLRVADIVLAHEWIDAGGDQHRRLPPESEPGMELACFYFRHPIRYEMTGRLRSEAIHNEDPARFQVVVSPVLRRLESGGDADLELMGRLSYWIVQRSHVQCLMGL